jgi:hypothetical protein
MVYKFEISKTYEGLLRIRATASNELDCALIVYEDDGAFLRLVKDAGLRSEDERCLEKAVVVAFSPMRIPSICEDLELSDDQLTFLHLGMARKSYA